MKNKVLIYGALGLLAFLGYKKYTKKTPVLGTSDKTSDDLKERIKMLENTARELDSKSKSELSKLQQEIDRREAEKQQRLAEIERLKGSKTSDDILKQQNADLLRKIAQLEKEMGIKDAQNKVILSQKEKELRDQIAKLKATITTKEDLIESINAKREAKVEMERLRTLEDFIGNEQEVIDRLTKTLDGIDTSTKSGQERAKVYIDLIKKAEDRKVKKATDTRTILELGLGRTGYQQLLPKANWTLNDLLDDSKHIQIFDRLSKYGDRAYYEFYPVDANVEFRKKGNWTQMLVPENFVTKELGTPQIVNVWNDTKEKAILSVVARDPRRYEVRIYGKSLD